MAEQIRRAITRAIPISPVIGLTGTGGAGKSSLNDELLQRFVRAFPDRQIGIVAVDPTRRRSGGALLGDRIRMNSLAAPNLFMRSLATRRQNLATSAVLKDVIDLYQLARFDLIVVETAGIGQSDTEIVDLVDLPVYVMTSEYGAPSQLEKIDMLDFADMVVLNKFEKRGAEDALRDVRKQWRRNHPDRMKIADADVPVFPTIASRFQRPGREPPVRRDLPRPGRQGRVGCEVVVQDVGPIEFSTREPLIPGAPRATSRRSPAAAAPRASASRRRSRPRAARTACTSRCARCGIRRCRRRSILLRTWPSARRMRTPRRALRAAYGQALDEVGAEGIGELKAWPAAPALR
ncbi:MAG: GTP-binding protein [Steroidobacteraceae bacterium]